MIISAELTAHKAKAALQMPRLNSFSTASKHEDVGTARNPPRRASSRCPHRFSING